MLKAEKAIIEKSIQSVNRIHRHLSIIITTVISQSSKVKQTTSDETVLIL